MPIRFDQLSSAPARALQIYLILIGCAANQQTIAYAKLAERAGLFTPTWLFASLGHLAEWCLHEGLPPLTSLAIAEDTGMPAPTIRCRSSRSRPSRTAPANSIGTPFYRRPYPTSSGPSASSRIVTSDPRVKPPD